MKAHIYAFTAAGALLSDKIRVCLTENGWDAKACAPLPYDGSLGGVKMRSRKLSEAVGYSFENAECIVFVGAAGIAVRSIAPYVADKKTDPAIICTDEKGANVISLLSGHIGGANRLAKLIAACVGGNAVITTATDVNSVFAVDEWADLRRLHITDFAMARRISSHILNGGKIGIYSEYPVEGILPDAFGDDGAHIGICISIGSELKPFDETLNLVPKITAVGVGCRRGASSEDIYLAVCEVLQSSSVSIHSLKGLYSIDLKKDETGLAYAAKRLGVPFITFGSRELESAEGTFTESKFVRSVTGTGTVCERAAALGGGNGKLIIPKTINRSVTVAACAADYTVRF